MSFGSLVLWASAAAVAVTGAYWTARAAINLRRHIAATDGIRYSEVDIEAAVDAATEHSDQIIERLLCQLAEADIEPDMLS